MARKRATAENIELLRSLEEAESQVSQLNKIKVSYAQQLEDLQKLADEETKVKSKS